MAQQGDMWFRLMLDHRQFVAGMSLTQREMQEVRVIAGDLAGGVGKLVPVFDKLTRLARIDGEQMNALSASYGQVALGSRAALVAARRHAQQLDFETDVLRERIAAGEKLSVAEKQRLTQNERISLAFQEGIDNARRARAKQLLEIRKVRNAERDARQQKEAADRAEKKALKDKSAADKKYLADVKQNSQVMEDVRKSQLKKGQAFFDHIQLRKANADKKYLADVKQNSRIMEDVRKTQLQKGQAFFDKVNQHKAAANKKYLADVKYNSQVMEDVRKGQLQKGQAFFDRVIQHKTRAEKKYLATVKYNSQIMEDQRKIQLQKGKAFFDRVQRHRAEAIKRETVAIREQTTAAGALQNQLLAIGRNIGFVTTAYRAYHFAISSVTAAMEQQRSLKAFEVFTGSSATAKRLLSDVRDVSGRTPLTFEATQQSMRTLLQYGVHASKVTDTLERLGDVSGGSTEQLQRLALAFGQITANGRLQGQELRQLIEAGFNPLQVISEQTGQSMFQLKLQMAGGAISAEMIADALRQATSEGGRFNDMLDQIGETPFGQVQILRGEIEKLKADMGSTPAFIGGGTADAISRILQSARMQLKVLAMAGEDAVFWADGLAKSFENSNPILKGLAYALRSMAMAEQSLYDTRVEREEQLRNARKEALQDQAVEEIQSIKMGRIYAKYGRDQVEHVRLLTQLRREGLEKEAQSLELAKKEADEQERRLAAIKEASQEARSAERAAKSRRDAIVRRHEDPQVTLQRQLGDLFNMERMGMFAGAPGVATAEKERLTQEFIDAKVNEIVESQKEAAQVATKGSSEEFNIMRDISMKNADSAEKREEVRHKARLQAMESVKAALDALPADLAEFFPVPVGF